MTADNGMDGQPSWQELRAQLEVAQREALAGKLAGEVMEASREALAAHMEEMRAALVLAKQTLHEHWYDGKTDAALSALLARNPTTGLTRRDALKQAEAYEAGYIDGWDHRAGTKPEDGDFRACGRRLAKELAAMKYSQAGETAHESR